MLFFDNVEDYELIKQYLPDTGGQSEHHVIITTKNMKDWQDRTSILGGNVIELKPFNKIEAIDYIKNTLPDVLEESALNLAKLFNNIPLGLSQSLAYIKNNAITIEMYLIEHDNFSKTHPTALPEILHDGKFDPHALNIYTTLSLIINSLAAQPKVIELLRLCSYMNADAIPEYLFNTMLNSKIESSRAIAILKGYSLISVTVEAEIKFIYIHSLLKTVTRINIGNNSWQFLQQAMECTHAKMDDTNNSKEVLEKNYPMLQHFLTLAMHYEEFMLNQLYDKEIKRLMSRSIVKIYVDCGNLYHVIGKFKDALLQYEQALVIANEVYKDDHLEAIASIHNCVGAMHNILENNTSSLMSVSSQLNN